MSFTLHNKGLPPRGGQALKQGDCSQFCYAALSRTFSAFLIGGITESV